MLIHFFAMLEKILLNAWDNLEIEKSYFFLMCLRYKSFVSLLQLHSLEYNIKIFYAMYWVKHNA